MAVVKQSADCNFLCVYVILVAVYLFIYICDLFKDIVICSDYMYRRMVGRIVNT
jgi:hypothetical protein